MQKLGRAWLNKVMLFLAKILKTVQKRIKITPRWAPVDDLKVPSQVVLLKNISCQHRPRQSGNYAVAVNLKLAPVGYTTPLKESCS